MQLIGIKSEKEELLDLINSVDVNRSGQLEFGEFVELMSLHMLAASGLEHDFRRPVVLDTFPLVARSFDVHSTVARSTAPPAPSPWPYACRSP